MSVEHASDSLASLAMLAKRKCLQASTSQSNHIVESPSRDFSLMSYNVLADELVSL